MSRFNKFAAAAVAGIALAASGWLTHAVEQAKFLLGQYWLMG